MAALAPGALRPSAIASALLMTAHLRYLSRVPSPSSKASPSWPTRALGEHVKIGREPETDARTPRNADDKPQGAPTVHHLLAPPPQGYAGAPGSTRAQDESTSPTPKAGGPVPVFQPQMRAPNPTQVVSPVVDLAHTWQSAGPTDENSPPVSRRGEAEAPRPRLAGAREGRPREGISVGYRRERRAEVEMCD